MYDVIFAYNGLYGGVSVPLQQVTSLRRRAQANAPAASYCLRRSCTKVGAEARRVHRASGSGGGACSAPLPPCFWNAIFCIPLCST